MYCTNCKSPIDPADASAGLPCRACRSRDRTVQLVGGTAEARAGAPFAVVGTGTVEPPSILLRALVEPTGSTPDGDVIVSVQPAWDAIIKLIQEDPDALFKMDPRKFEELIAASYEQAGFDEVILTPRSGDFGRDVIATKRGFWSIRFVDSAKRYASNRLVPAADVQSLLGVLAGDQQASKGIVTTSSDFAPGIESHPLIKPFVPNRLELVNGEALKRRLLANQKVRL